MKKLFILILIISFTGCQKTAEYIPSKLEETVAEDKHYGACTSNPSFVGTNIICDELKDAKLSTDDLSNGTFNGYFVTNDGSLYQLNTKLFSNNKNCIKINIGNHKISYMVNKRFYDQEKNLVFSNGITVEEGKDKYGYSYSDDYFIQITEDFDFISYGADATIFIKDNTVFWYYYKDNENKEKRTFEISSDETIKGVFGSVIKTDKNYYMPRTLNAQECQIYADVKCEVGYVKTKFGEVYNDILFANDGILIDKDGNYCVSGSLLLLDGERAA